MIRRYAVGLEYDGTHYAGWQRQLFFAATIQEQVDCALSRVAAAEIASICAGRTDAGVHATMQVIHFDTDAQRSDFAWLAGTNRYLPSDIRLQWISMVDEHFHARYSARARQYRYLIRHRSQPSALWAKRCYWHRKSLDSNIMHAAAQVLVGEHDFSAFRAAECQAKTAWRCIHRIDVRERHGWIAVDISGNAFLHHMVRNIVGTLLAVGDKRYPPEWVESVLHSRNRCMAGVTAPAQGLYLCGVTYPPEFLLPHNSSAWIPDVFI
ncbi:MAG: tRNA pseudouridine(38-40) synthase TruA [Cardiobacteriaceae bacterium]|nr:tRNA pseudouridine(38-40) synthase TruA [Cardiobacteriaceae bacterium]